MKASGGPTFVAGAAHSSDIQFTPTLAPDGKTNSILFDNFIVRLEPGGEPMAARAITISFALADVTTEAVAKIDLRGAATLDAGATGTVIFRAFGQTQVLEPLLDTPSSTPEAPFTKEMSFKIPAGSNADMTVVVIAERGGNLRGETRVTIDSLDMSIGPIETK
jgi:hypothetical protein